jgi:hypothetical protein
MFWNKVDKCWENRTFAHTTAGFGYPRYGDEIRGTVYYGGSGCKPIDGKHVETTEFGFNSGMYNKRVKHIGSHVSLSNCKHKCIQKCIHDFQEGDHPKVLDDPDSPVRCASGCGAKCIKKLDNMTEVKGLPQNSSFIMLMDKTGKCSYAEKVYNAERAGASAAIIASKWHL